MGERFSDEWFAAVQEAAASLPEIPGLSFVFDIEITEAPGKVRAHGRVVDGRPVQVVPGKFVAASPDEAVQVNFSVKAKRFEPLLSGEVSPLVAYMRGELKVDGEYELVVDHFANRCDRTGLEAFRSVVYDLTD